MYDPAALGASEEVAGVFFQHQRTALPDKSAHLLTFFSVADAWHVGLILHTFHLEELQKCPSQCPDCVPAPGGPSLDSCTLQLWSNLKYLRFCRVFFCSGSESLASLRIIGGGGRRGLASGGVREPARCVAWHWARKGVDGGRSCTAQRLQSLVVSRDDPQQLHWGWAQHKVRRC